jgi:hypothetical protein
MGVVDGATVASCPQRHSRPQPPTSEPLWALLTDTSDGAGLVARPWPPIATSRSRPAKSDVPCVPAIEAFNNAKAVKERHGPMIKMLAAECDCSVAAVRKMRTSSADRWEHPVVPSWEYVFAIKGIKPASPPLSALSWAALGQLFKDPMLAL